jgi:hypothetical protein
MTRHLREHLPAAKITACDIHDMAVSFVRETFGVSSVLSVDEPEKLDVGPSKFDVICAVSFFSHLPRETWSRWLKSLAFNVAPNGVLIFTTHGLRSQLGSMKPGADGFAFSPVSEQDDLDPSKYGTSLTTFDFVYRNVRDLDGVVLVHFQEALWWGHQDAYVIRKIA